MQVVGGSGETVMTAGGDRGEGDDSEDKEEDESCAEVGADGCEGSGDDVGLADSRGDLLDLGLGEGLRAK